MATERYRKYLTRAQMADLMALISGRNVDLIRFEEVANRLKARQRREMGTENVPLDKIVGSVGRYRDFTREFLPRSGANKERWTNIDAAMNSLEGLPPVELYKIGDAYFVRDGNHRVSVARANGLSSIEAYVTEYQIDVPLTADDFERDQWMIQAEYADFLRKTRLDKLRPGHDLRITEPGRYAILLHHIEVHQYLRNQELARAGSEEWLDWDAAVESWYDNVYMPMVEQIRRFNVLTHFPDRTEADLYLWVVYHREQLAQSYDLAPLSPEAAVSTFTEAYSDLPLERTVKGLRLGIHHLLSQDEPPLGMSREEFDELRARYEAGEITLSEAEERAQLAAADDAVVNGEAKTEDR